MIKLWSKFMQWSKYDQNLYNDQYSFNGQKSSLQNWLHGILWSKQLLLIHNTMLEDSDAA